MPRISPRVPLVDQKGLITREWYRYFFENEVDISQLSSDYSLSPSVPEPEIADDYFHINVYRAQPVAIIDGGRKVFALSAATTPRSLAAAAGVTVYPEDGIVSQPTYNFVKDGTIGQQVVIDPWAHETTPYYEEDPVCADCGYYDCQCPEPRCSD